ncbi:hypothetical protein ACFYW9_36685 [Streptomyces sp. NPDC002698]
MLTPVITPATLTTCAAPTTCAAFGGLVTLATPTSGPAPGRR